MSGLIARYWRPGKRITPVVSTIVLLLITFLASFVITSFVIEIRRPKSSPMAFFSIEGAQVGSEKLTLIHEGGDMIKNAFKLVGGKIEWMDLEMRINGVRIKVEGGAELAGKNGDVGTVHFNPGDMLSFPIKRLEPGDEVLLIYSPFDTIFVSLEV